MTTFPSPALFLRLTGEETACKARDPHNTNREQCCSAHPFCQAAQEHDIRLPVIRPLSPGWKSDPQTRAVDPVAIATVHGVDSPASNASFDVAARSVDGRGRFGSTVGQIRRTGQSQPPTARNRVSPPFHETPRLVLILTKNDSL
ncbi:hypothetical protein QO034_02585 [Sedimentitalea sp. JM2-8]|uniref:Uncharacterized protein n=1 Tax=Sedimentitalea xiamensis TaxID=3050037 RepID=A0ABT7FA57_9RHOB|nr:hypothetical protein [Sedimentitalea xiamensis]MDK3071987.1 hypothetical protein [Sedimentitalea xiamensis]